MEFVKGPEFEKALRRYRRAERKIRKLEEKSARKIEEATNNLDDCEIALGPMLKPEDWESMSGYGFKPAIGDWECAKSPIDVCVYDLNGWNGCDECVFCGDPEERK